MLLNLTKGAGDQDRVLLSSDYEGVSTMKFFEHGANLSVDCSDNAYDDWTVVLDGKAVVDFAEAYFAARDIDNEDGDFDEQTTTTSRMEMCQMTPCEAPGFDVNYGWAYSLPRTGRDIMVTIVKNGAKQQRLLKRDGHKFSF